MSDIEIEIDGKKCLAKPNAMVIQVADEAGIYIPRFCYHKHLTVAANCRMCLVEVEKSPKTLPACATPVTSGMKVFTRTSKALAAQKAVMEFLLINHPLDCPICDQGGECELQDLSLGFGADASDYREGKRSVKDKYIGPLIETEMTRCIHCTRCVRFGTEVAGIRELGVTNRGEHMEIGTYIDHAMRSEVSGNVIDLCPVGALTSKPFRFKARAWELQQFPTISAHDCLGSNLYAHTRNGKVMRFIPREEKNIQQTWISDRDRFSYEGLNHEDRLKVPMIKRDNRWQETDWQTALDYTVEGLQKVLNAHSAEQVAALAHPSATLEEFYLLQKLLRSLGSNNIDSRLRQTDFSDDHLRLAHAELDMSVVDLADCDVILLVGSNIQKEQPIASLQIRRASLNQAKIFAINPVAYDFNFLVTDQIVTAPQNIAVELAGIVKAIISTSQPQNNLQQALNHISVSESHALIAQAIMSGKNVCMIVGNIAFNVPNASAIRELVQQLKLATQCKLGFLTEGANAKGAWIAGAVPHHACGFPVHKMGLNAKTQFENLCKAYVLLNVEPDLDYANPQLAASALSKADFVVSLSLYQNAFLAEHAHVILPIAAFTETAGTFINVTSDWQSFSGVANAYEASRPAWKILRVLANLLAVDGFEFESAEEVLAEIKTHVLNQTADEVYHSDAFNFSDLKTQDKLTRIGEIPIYHTDAIVRHSPPLQAAQAVIDADLSCARMNAKTAESFAKTVDGMISIKQSDHEVTVPLQIDARIADHCVYLPGATALSAKLANLYGDIEQVN